MYFTDAHDELRVHIRKFLATEVQPHLEEWEESTFPDSIFKRFGELGFLGLRYPPEYGGQGGDYFSAVVLSEEMAKAGLGGLGMAVDVQTEMATPPVFKFGTEEQKRKWVVPAIRGEHIAALAITEPDAGSDVAGITTVARRDGDHFVVNGRKIFITSGARCHWALVVTKTDRERGHKGYNLLVIEKGTPGFQVTRTLKKLGMHSSDTAELLFEDCRVPVRNLIGEEGEGFKNLMWELQGERMIAAAGAIAGRPASSSTRWTTPRTAGRLGSRSRSSRSSSIASSTWARRLPLCRHSFTRRPRNGTAASTRCGRSPRPSCSRRKPRATWRTTRSRSSAGMDTCTSSPSRGPGGTHVWGGSAPARTRS